MANEWFVLIPAGDTGDSASFLEQVDFRAQIPPGSQYNTLQAGGAINYDGMSMVKWKGPYATEAEAQQAQQAKPSPEGAGAVAAGLGNLTGVNAIGDFFHRLTEAATWERVGEVVLGGIMLYVGIKAVASGTAVGKAAKSATKPVKSAAKAAGAVAAPELTLATRVAAKKAAPKTTARIASHRAQVKQYGSKRPYAS